MKVLLLDTAFAAAPIYNYLVQEGHEVWVTGNRAADVLARRAGARWIEQDYSDVEAVERHIARLGIEAVLPGCTDVSIETCLRLRLGAELRDSVEVNATLGNKAQFRALCAALGLSAPLIVEEDAFPAKGQFICKPVDAFSGRGITIFDGEDLTALAEALEFGRQASPARHAIIETFATGQLHSCSTFIKDFKAEDMFFVREGSSVNPYAVDTSHVTDEVPPACVSILRTDIDRLSGALGLRDGLLHVQFILSDEGPMIVEVARRCPGDLYPLLIEYSTGYEYAARYAAAFLGLEHRTAVKRRRHILRHTVTADRDAYFEGLMFNENAPVYAFYPLVPVGEALKERQGNRAGLLFCEADSQSGLIALYDRFMERRSYMVAI